jgi:hypothetical protein
MDEQPRYTGSKGTLLGCFAALIVGLVAAVPLLFALVWGGAHCEPVPECQRAGERLFLVEVAVVVGVAGLIGLGIRAVFNGWMSRKMASGRGAEAERDLGRGMALVMLAAFLAVWWLAG